jgi:hypothetical protein
MNNYRKTLVTTLIILMITAMIIPAALAEITTDKADYAPTDTVYLFGTGFTPNHEVDLTLIGPIGFTTWTWSVMSDENGTITTTYGEGLMDGTFTLTATDGITPTQTTTFTDSPPVHNVNFATSGLPSGVSITISWSKTNNAGNPATGSTTFASPGTSLDEGTKPGTTFTYSGFPTSVTVSSGPDAGTYDLKSVTPNPSPSSGFTTGSAGSRTTVTATYEKRAITPVDSTAPETTITSDPTGWIGATSATFEWTGSDDVTTAANLVYSTKLDGGAWSAFSTSTTITLTGLTDGSHSFYVKAKDQTGNEDLTPAEQTFGVDTTAPETTITSGPTGWIGATSATFEWTGSDGITKLENLVYSYRIDGGSWSTFSSTTSTTFTGLLEGSHTFEVKAKDQVGNEDLTPAKRSFSIDLTPPETTESITSGSAGSNGWYISNLVVSLSAVDSGSGVKEIHYILNGGTEVTSNTNPTVFTISTEGANTLSYWAVDNTNNAETAKSATLKIDKTDPVITVERLPTANSFEWNNKAVVVTFTASDTISGIDTVSALTGAGTIALSHTSGTDTWSCTLSGEGADQWVTGTAADKAGRTKEVGVSGINIDLTNPILTVQPYQATAYIGQVVTISWTASDALSGIDSLLSDTSPITVDTSSFGLKTGTITITDKAGNSVSQDWSVNVAYKFIGFLQPINMPTQPMSFFKQGSTIPVKFQVVDSNGAYVNNVVANILVQKVGAGGNILSETEEVSTSAATTGTLFRYDATSGNYIFNLNTKGLEGSNTLYKISAIITNGPSPSVVVGLKK